MQNMRDYVSDKMKQKKSKWKTIEKSPEGRRYEAEWEGAKRPNHNSSKNASIQRNFLKALHISFNRIGTRIDRNIDY